MGTPGRTSQTFALGVLAALACSGGSSPAAPSPAPVGASTPQTPAPTVAAGSNVVLVLVDDLDRDSIDQLPNLLERVASRGVRFDNAFASQPLCCPSRVSILLGQYTHNHRILTNFSDAGACVEEFRDSGYETEHVGNWFQQAGYRTGLVGKYLNRFPGDRSDADPRRVPRGWDDFQGIVRGGGSEYYDYTFNENGELVDYGGTPSDYITTVLAEKAVRFIGEAGERPFFLKIATTAPHLPAAPPPDHVNAFAGAMAPRTPSFNEVDTSDKPRWYQENLLPMSPEEIAELDRNYRDRLRTMLGVQDLVERLDEALAAAGRLESTYLVVMSDHGYHQGHHRFRRGKDTAYEPSIRIPLMIRGPGIPVGQRRGHLVVNVDLPMTLAGLAGVPVPDWVDGRSLQPLLVEAPPALEEWRTEILLEHPPVSEDDLGIPGWWGLRTLDATYVEYVTGEREYYDLRDDPDQLENLHDRVDPALLDELSRRLAEDLACGGTNCP